MQRNYGAIAADLDAHRAATKDRGVAGEVPGPVAASLTLRKWSEIPMQRIAWLWTEWLAAGNLHVLGNVPGTGKTTIALAISATTTAGGVWPDGTRCEKSGNEVIWSGEDDAATTLIPRPSAMSADLSRVHIVAGVTDHDGRRSFDPAHDVPLLIEAASEVGDVALLIVDPLVNSIAGDNHKNTEVRRGLARLVTFAQELYAAVLGITHFSKGTSGSDPLDRLTGSLAFGALARVVFGAARKLDDEGNEAGRVLVRIKSNIGPVGGALAYALEMSELGDVDLTPRFSQ